MSEYNEGDLVTPCHGAPLLVITTYSSGYHSWDEPSEIMCSYANCGNSWTPEGIASEWNVAAGGRDSAPEMFPGTLAALDALTIRKATPCESKK